jgi:Ca2+-binding RTX toxin-like protein
LPIIDLDGGDGNDILNSGGPGSALYGGAGDDDMSALGGGNYLDGENGNNIVSFWRKKREAVNEAILLAA